MKRENSLKMSKNCVIVEVTERKQIFVFATVLSAASDKDIHRTTNPCRRITQYTHQPRQKQPAKKQESPAKNRASKFQEFN